MSSQTVLLTGGLGNVGLNAARTLVAKGHRAVILDLDTPANRKKATRLQKQIAVDIHWANLCDAASVNEAVGLTKPHAIIHTAAVIAPFAFYKQDLAQAVNVGGTRNLIDAAQGLDRAPRLVFTSSYTVHGPRNPHRNLPRLTHDTPVAPADIYAQHKVEGERLVRDSGLDYTIVRLPAIAPHRPAMGHGPRVHRHGLSLVTQPARTRPRFEGRGLGPRERHRRHRGVPTNLQRGRARLRLLRGRERIR